MKFTGDSEFCPDCNEPLEYDEVDIDGGVQRGNYGCPSCGWTPKSMAVDETKECEPKDFSDLNEDGEP